MAVGEVFNDRYRVSSFQRSGRFGDLWNAKDSQTGNAVSVKLLKPDLYTDGEAIRRFQREVKLLLAFEHPYLLRVLDHGVADSGDPFLVLEHRDGRLLDEVVAEGPLPPAKVAHIGAQVARVLAAARARNIVHRGLTTHAVLLLPTDDVKVLEFGLALPIQGDDPRLTSQGQRLGDPTYMAPEYIRDFTFDARTDLYALGVLLYILLVGEPPFTGRAIMVLDGHANETPEAPSARRPDADIPGWLDQTVLALLAKDPDDRPDATAVARALVSKRWPPPP